jgi:serine/threonine-protein kinase
MAPEQATGGNADSRTDLYSVGVVLYELLAGHPPFQAPAFGQLVAQVLSSPPPPLPSHTRNGDPIPNALGAVVKRCLAKNPEDRYPSLRELARALESAAQAPVRRGATRWLVAALAVAALGAGVMMVRSTLRPQAVPVVTGKLIRAGTPTPPPAAAPAVPEPAPVQTQIKLTVVSDPQGARVVELPSGRLLGTTPLSTTVSRSSSASRLRLERAGRKTTEVEVVPDAPLEVRVALPRVPRPAAQASGKVVRKPGQPDPFKL